MIKAAIDIGTNSTRLAVFETKPELKVVYQTLKITALGKDFKNGLLDKNSILRTVRAVKKFKSTAKQHNAEKIYAAATQAVRLAENKDSLLNKIKSLSIKTFLLTPEEEALLTYKGVKKTLKLPASSMVFDIGGGSTEFIFKEKEKIKTFSLPLGALLLKNKKNKEEYIREQLKKIKMKAPAAAAVGGTATTYASVLMCLEKYDAEKVHGSVLNINEVFNLTELLSVMTEDEIKLLKGMEKPRAGVIYEGGLILSAIIKKIGIKKLIVSDNGILAGLVSSL